VAGLFVAPALTTAYLAADEPADPDRRVRAGAWVNTAFNTGSSAGTAAVGLLVGRVPLPLCFVLAGAAALVSAATALVPMVMFRPGPGSLPAGCRSSAEPRAR
jgi:predicted MFS family arabinose efflux permease